MAQDDGEVFCEWISLGQLAVCDVRPTPAAIARLKLANISFMDLGVLGAAWGCGRPDARRPVVANGDVHEDKESVVNTLRDGEIALDLIARQGQAWVVLK